MFCKYCGRTLLKGEKCSCSGSVKASGEYGYREDGSYNSSYSSSEAGGYDYNSGYSDSFTDSYNGYNNQPNTGRTYNASSRASTPVLIISVIVIMLIVIIIIGFVSSMILKDSSNIEYNYDDNAVYDEDYKWEDDKYSSSSSTAYTTGTLSDTTYENEWANLVIPIPARYEACDSNTLAEYSGDIDECVFLAYKGSTGVISVYICNKDWAKEYATDTILESYVESYTESLIEGGWESSDISDYEFETVKIGGNNYLTANVEIQNYGNVAFLLHRIDGGYVYITIDDLNRNRTDKIIDSFEGYNQ